jgi:hypothetical protein
MAPKWLLSEPFAKRLRKGSQDAEKESIILPLYPKFIMVANIFLVII